MGDFPKNRVAVPKRAFRDVGLNFAGPFWFRKAPKTMMKVYKAIFVCFATKAVHLELVSDLTAQRCLAALRHFIARRGSPEVIYSDDGSNFVGAKFEIEAVQRVWKDQHQTSLQAEAAGLNLRWAFNPPRAPHFGGLWEAGVKKHLHRVMGNRVLTFEKLTTLLCQIECVLNSRPLCPISGDPNDADPLTPAHLTIEVKLEGFAFKVTGTADEATPTQPTKRWAHVQNLLGHFRKRWSSEFVTSLLQRRKWT